MIFSIASHFDWPARVLLVLLYGCIRVAQFLRAQLRETARLLDEQSR